MHPDSPIRQLAEALLACKACSMNLVPFDGGGFCIELHVIGGIHIYTGGRSLPEAIGEAFLELKKRTGAPAFADLLARSSLAPKPRRRHIERPAEGITARPVGPALHLSRSDARRESACGLVRDGRDGHFAQSEEEVTCGRCKSTSYYNGGAYMASRKNRGAP